MCLSCGCGDIGNEHYDPRNITEQDILDAAAAAHISPDEVVNNVENFHGAYRGGDFQDEDMDVSSELEPDEVAEDRGDAVEAYSGY